MANRRKSIPAGRQASPTPTAKPEDSTDALPAAEIEALEPAAEILRPLLRDPKQANQVVAMMATTVELFRGPLPPPDHFKGYEEVVPGGAREILNMAAREQRHRHRMQTLEMIYPYLGWFAGFVGFLASLAGATYLAMDNHEAVAGGMLGLPCLGVIGWFIRSRLPNAQSADAPPRATSDRRGRQPTKRRG
jgi:hypothetical protein